MPLITQDPSNGLVQGSAAMCGRMSCIRKARLDQQIYTDHAQQLRSVRLRVTTMFDLNDLLTPRKTDLIIARKRSRGSRCPIVQGAIKNTINLPGPGPQ